MTRIFFRSLTQTVLTAVGAHTTSHKFFNHASTEFPSSPSSSLYVLRSKHRCVDLQVTEEGERVSVFKDKDDEEVFVTLQ